jgi:hypothetical protein
MLSESFLVKGAGSEICFGGFSLARGKGVILAGESFGESSILHIIVIIDQRLTGLLRLSTIVGG